MSCPWRSCSPDGAPELADPNSEVLDRIAAHPRVTPEPLPPLGHDAVAELARRSLGERADAEVVEACFSATAGNPFYLHELLLALREDPGLPGPQLAARALALAPDAVTRSLRIRVGRLGEDAGALARAVAILGDEVPLRQAAALAGLRVSAAATAADRLAGVEVLLAREPLRYVHPLVKHAIEVDVPVAERASRHLDAARLLYAEGESAERVAAHLLRGRAEGSDWVVDRLRAAAREAQIRGAAQSAVSYLERALEEPPRGELRGGVLADLGAAEATTGSPAAADHLCAAAELASDPARRAQLRLEQGHALHARGRHGDAAAAYQAGLDALDASGAAGEDPPETAELHDALQTAYVATAMLTPELRGDAAQRSAALLQGVTGGQARPASACSSPRRRYSGRSRGIPPPGSPIWPNAPGRMARCSSTRPVTGSPGRW